MQNYFDSKIGVPVEVVLKRGDQSVTKEIIPQKLEETGRGGIGIGLVKTGIVSYPLFKSVIKGGETTLFLTKEIIFAFYNLIKNLIFTQEVSVEISGPVGIAVITGQVSRLGFIYILQFTALLSLNLAIINFMPIPALDGGRVLFLLIEKFRGKAMSSHIEAIFHNVGFILLMLLVVLVTFRDVTRFSGSFVGLWDKIVSFF